ncbi:hypothetical protein CN681_10745 [Bacillus toyonensis]|nr:hypothetical protein CN681_10745 [Bacillus toyonensis]PGA50136.1 hypothetical protein COL86_30480 [Bacillus toyonensis]PGB91185.1 hypothetical protein COM19_30590 [Bacillus toyonensis]
MYVEQLRWLPAIPCPKPIHLLPTHFAFLEEGVFLAKMIKFFYNQGVIDILKLMGMHSIPLLALL